MNTQAAVTQAKTVLMQNYPIQPVVMERGEGCVLFDTDGKRYLDFAAGIAVASLGHAHPKVVDAISSQAAKLMMCQGSYATTPRIHCAELLVQNSCMDRVFFCNSGAEAVEAALKLARKRAYDVHGAGKHEIIAFRKSFHGRTYGAMSVTEKRHDHPQFAPYVEGVQFADFNDLASVEALISDKTAAIIIEPVQGEGGIYAADAAFLKGLRELCDTHNALLIYDEIQCGMGRIGSLFAYTHFGVEPDILCLAKGLGSGFPVGALLARDEVAAHFEGGVHGTTYGGNPLATAVAGAVLEVLLSDGFLAHVAEMGAYFQTQLRTLAKAFPAMKEVRGLGLLVGVEMDADVGALLAKLRDAGMLATKAGASTLRLTPPLIVTKSEMDEAIGILQGVLEELGN